MPPQEQHEQSAAKSPANDVVIDSSERSQLLQSHDGDSSVYNDMSRAVLPSESSYLNLIHVEAVRNRWKILTTVAIIAVVATVGLLCLQASSGSDLVPQPKGPYQLVELQKGRTFFDYYDFYVGADSIGSAGYQMYVDNKEAADLGIIGIGTEQSEATMGGARMLRKEDKASQDEEFIFMSSAPNNPDAPDKNMRSSVRLEGKRRFNRGLFILDIRHMPVGCGVWPAFWMADEDNWPGNGEIDIVEGVNYQTHAKTALHTSDQCSMYAHVPDYAVTNGEWERATGIPNTFTGEPDYETSLPADNCYVMAPHQWANQGCIMKHTSDQTIGAPINEQGGGVYVLELDPANGHIKSWVFSNGTTPVPDNLQKAMDTADSKNPVSPNPNRWTDPANPWQVIQPYAYFAIGDGSGCSSDHFDNMRLIFNLAFCGTVAGNRYPSDCPAQAEEFRVTREDGSLDPVLSCNKWIASDPDELDEAYWKIKGVYVYERETILLQ